MIKSKLRLAKILLCIVATGAATQAHAWVVVAHSKASGYSYASANSENPESAKQNALQGCSKKALECVIVGQPIHGPGALVVAWGTTAIGKSFNADANIAAREALADCKKASENCSLSGAVWDEGWKWFSVAESSSGTSLRYGFDSDVEAESQTLKACQQSTDRPGTCNTKKEFTRAGHAWFATSESGDKSSSGVGWSQTSKEEARVYAISPCEKGIKAGARCKVVEERENPAATQEPLGFKALVASIERARVSQASRAPTLSIAHQSTKSERYSQSCRNADCVRLYEDGRRVHYAACLNPATGLPMNDSFKLGGCGGFDSRGNVFGMNNS